MWNEGGGFSTPGSQGMNNTPGGGGADKKRQRAQNLVPVSISSILEAEEEVLKICGQEVGMVSIVAQVKSVNHEATKSVYSMEDDGGTMEVIQWVDEGKDTAKDSVVEDSYVRVVGSVRSNKDKKYIMAFKILELESKAEIEGHLLDIAYAKLKIKQLKEMEDRVVNGTGSGLSNSMMTGGSYASSQNGSSSASSSAFSNSKHDAAFKMISGCSREEGISRDELMASLSKKMTKNELDDALDYLSGDGHIYTTIDDDHFKTTDS